MARPTPKVDELMTIVAKIGGNSDQFAADVRAELKELLEARWASGQLSML
jgi:hypothetical protein